MNVYINGVVVGSEYRIQSAKATDNAGGRGDICEVVFPDAAKCGGFTSCDGDTLEIREGGYTTGVMRIDSVERTSDGQYVMKAVSLPESARETGFGVYENVTLAQLLRAGAQEMGLKSALYGVNGDTLLRRVVRREQTWPEFLTMIFRMESAVIKFEGDSVLAIGYAWAFEQTPVRVLRDDGKGTYFQRQRFRTMMIRTGLIEATAKDSAAIGGMYKRQYNEQVYDMQQAKRAAKGYLLDANLECEVYKCSMTLDTGIAAMNRIDLFGNHQTAGNWYVHSVTHEFKEKTTHLTLRRCIDTIK